MSNRHYVAFPLPNAYSFNCANFTNNNGEKEAVIVVLVPISFSQRNVFEWTVGWSCSLGRVCENRNCIYSYNAHRRRE